RKDSKPRATHRKRPRRDSRSLQPLRRPANGRRRATIARTATTNMSQDPKSPSTAELRPKVRSAEGASHHSVKRRDFLKVLGVTGAAVTAAGCSEDAGKLIPYLVSPDQTVPGVSTYYATVCRECVAACGVISETRDGRSIKLEGNPEHPVNKGALCARGQSALQGLYNPDRFRSPMYLDGGTWKAITWEAAIARLGAAVAGASPKRSVFL